MIDGSVMKWALKLQKQYAYVVEWPKNTNISVFYSWDSQRTKPKWFCAVVVYENGYVRYCLWSADTSIFICEMARWSRQLRLSSMAPSTVAIVVCVCAGVDESMFVWVYVQFNATLQFRFNFRWYFVISFDLWYFDEIFAIISSKLKPQCCCRASSCGIYLEN